jgi:MFS family permease
MSVGLKSSKGFYGWINLAVTAIVGIVATFYMISFSYFLDELIDEFGWATRDTSFAATINMIAMGLCGPVAGIFIFKFGARRAMVLGNSLAFLGFLIVYLHSQLWQLFLGYGLFIGVAAGLGGMLAGMTVINNWFAKKRALALSLFLGSGGVAGIFMGRTIVWVIEAYGWRNTALIASFVILLLAVILPAIFIRNTPKELGQVPDGPESEAEEKRKTVSPKTVYRTPVDFTAKEAMRTRCLWLLVAYFCLNMLAMGAIMTHQIVYLKDIGISKAVAGTALGVMSGFMAFSQLSVGFIGKRFSMHAIAVGGEVLKIIGLVVLICTDTKPFVFLYMIVLGLGFGFAVAATMNIYPNYFGAMHYPKIMGSVRLFWTFVGAAGAPFAGHIRDVYGTYLPAFQGAVAIIAIGLICLVFAKAPVHPSLKEPKSAEAIGTMA